ncbi:MAG TPA: NAD(P)H-binding protein [Aggregatilinea sp.]|uniref:SDR family oxidoreductase n=1 Tax=Aggregatilinea sp. TaxID=2806333 RepID=UPI002C5FF7BA|nr:NAD-dependent epimerase/dehydratase family protein [Aggregatilinea sp.]HML21099.1 NAD(P)H-binding protein [Aggregatilinea sp.]
MSQTGQVHTVTGAFGYSGKYIATHLLERGHTVHTLTNSTRRANPFGDQITVHPFNFDDPAALTESLRGVSVLYNTYWVRFNHRLFTHADAVRNTLTLFEAAQRAGVERVVHVSITNPSEDLGLEYFAGKAQLEAALQSSGLSYAILRPAVLFGKEDILINNIAWTLRRLPIFGVFGDGSYRIQPIYVDDLAALAVELGAQTENVTLNAVGPETFTFRELVAEIGHIIGKPRPMVSMPPRLAYAATRVVGWLVQDVFLTWEEVEGLMAGTLAVNTPPTAPMKLTEWAKEHADTLGRSYANELARRKDRARGY